MFQQLFNLTGKTALVTGASSGLGRAIATAYAQSGAKVVALGRSQQKLNELSQESDQFILKNIDITDKDAIKNMMHDIESENIKIDILVNSAGIGKKSPIFEDKDDQIFEKTYEINVTALWNMTSIIANHMKNHKIAGSIINIASINGANCLRPELSAYASSKAAVLQMTKALVGELSPYNIRINSISPGLFHTPLTDYKLHNTELKSQQTKNIPLGFVPDPIEIAGSALFLASNNASKYVTGSCITIDGGNSWGG